MAYEAFRQKGREVTAAVRQDDTKFFESLAQQTRHMDESSDSQGLWKQLRKVLPKNKARRKNQPLTLQGLQDDWIPHFSALEAGVLTTVLATAMQHLPSQWRDRFPGTPQMAANALGG